MTTTESGIMVSVLLRDAVAPVAAGQLPVAVDKLELFKTEAFVAYPPARSFYNHAILSGGEFDPGMAALAINHVHDAGTGNAVGVGRSTAGRRSLAAPTRSTISPTTSRMGRPRTKRRASFGMRRRAKRRAPSSPATRTICSTRWPHGSPQRRRPMPNNHDSLIRSRVRINVPTRVPLRSPDSPDNEIIFVTDGVLALYIMDARGSRQIVGLRFPGEND
jgi:hypothetical protein